MKIIKNLLVVLILISTTSCQGKYAGDFSGVVLDEETGKPIEGAIVVVQWTETKGMPGLSHHKPYKTAEVEMDKDGRFLVSGVDKVNIDGPEIVIYKEGYIAWRNDFIFPKWEARKDFRYGKGVSIQLVLFNKEISREGYARFLSHAFMDKPTGLSNAISKELQ